MVRSAGSFDASSSSNNSNAVSRRIHMLKGETSVRMSFATLAIAGGLLFLAGCGSSGGYSSQPAAAQPTQAAAPLSTQTGSSQSGDGDAYSYPAAASPNPGSSGAAAQGPAVLVTQNPKLGAILTDAHGMTLYTFKNDKAGVSSCTAACTANWMPLKLSTGSPSASNGLTAKLELISRDDGSKQVTYNGLPLYTYIGDKAPGDANGQGVAGLWFVAMP